MQCEYRTKPFQCGTLKLINEMSLNKHILRKHQGKSVAVNCKGPSYQKKEKTFICPNCNKGFYKQEHLDKHSKIHIPSEKKFECPICQKKFTRKYNLTSHTKVHEHQGKSVSVNCIGPSFQKKEKTFICPKCNKGFYKQERLDKHSKIHMPSEKFECPTCQKKFTRKCNLTSHTRVHEPNKEEESDHLCVYCGRSFSSFSSLTVHMRRHTGEKPFKCNICEKGFPRTSDLQCHRRTHTGEKPNVCTVCGKGFSRSNKLVRHMHIHTGHRPYKCTICSRAFTQSNDLTLHVRRHTGDKPYVCDVCGDRFIQGTALRAHRKKQGHGDQVNQPTPFAADSVNNPSLDNGPHRVARVESVKPERNATANTSSAPATRASTVTTTPSSTTSAQGKSSTAHNYVPSRATGFRTTLSVLNTKKLQLKGLSDTIKTQDDDVESNSTEPDSEFTNDDSIMDLLSSSPVEEIEVAVGVEILPEDKTENLSIISSKSYSSHVSFEKHIKRQLVTQRYTCKICVKSFTKLSSVKRHILTHKSLESLACTDLKSKMALMSAHEKLVVIKSEDITDEILSDIMIEDIREGRMERYIKEPKVETTHSDCNSNGGDDNDVGDDSESDKKLSKLMGKTKRGPNHQTRIFRQHKCSLCDQIFKRKNHIIRHMSAHKYEFPFKCDKCTKVFPNNETLMEHKRMQCEYLTKPFQCGTCGLKFTYEMYLKKHILRNTNGKSEIANCAFQKKEKTFICPNCNKGFYKQEHLDKHSKIHVLGEFECSICQKKFTRKCNLKSHTRVHEPKKEELESDHLCVYCGRSFSSASSLTVHMRRHTGEKPYKCDICEKGFPRSSDLQCHRRTHTGEKPNVCTICGKGFSRSNKLVRHMHIHTGQRPYKCTICDRAFTQSNDLTLHVRRHTGDKPYVCGVCGDSFIQGTALQAHRKKQGHYDEVNQSTPFAANSVNNPSQDHGPHRVARVESVKPKSNATANTRSAPVTSASTVATTSSSTTPAQGKRSTAHNYVPSGDAGFLATLSVLNNSHSNQTRTPSNRRRKESSLTYTP